MSSFSTRFLSEISLVIPLMPITSPAVSFMGESVRLTSIIVPSFLCLNVSISLSVSPLLIFPIYSFSASTRNWGANSRNFPAASSAV